MHTLFWHVLAREDSPVLICLDHTLSFVSILFYRILPFFNAFLSTVSICIYLYLLSFTFCYPTPAQCMVSVYCFCVRNMNVGTIPPQPQPQTWVYRAPLGRFGEQWVINGLTVMIPPLALIWSYLILFDLICTCWFWFRLPPLALFDSRTTYCKGICSPTRSSNPCKLSNRCLGAIAATWGTDELSKSSLRVARVDDGVADNTDTHTHILWQSWCNYV